VPQASPEGLDLLNQMLCWNPLRRCTASVQHPFFANVNPANPGGIQGGDILGQAQGRSGTPTGGPAVGLGGGQPPSQYGAGFGAPQSQGAGFGAPQSGFGAPQAPGFGAPQAPGFGAPQAQAPGFGAPAAQPGFGAPQAASGGGGTPVGATPPPGGFPGWQGPKPGLRAQAPYGMGAPSYASQDPSIAAQLPPIGGLSRAGSGAGFGLPSAIAPAAGAGLDKFLPSVARNTGSGGRNTAGSGPGSSHSDQKSGPGLRYLRMARYQPGTVVQRSPQDGGPIVPTGGVLSANGVGRPPL
jgi:hypothetical protein